MKIHTCTQEVAEAANLCFDREVYRYLNSWVQNHEDKTLLQFEQPMEVYLANDALRDFFLNTEHPVQKLLEDRHIARHLGRRVRDVYFDPTSGDPLFSVAEQRIYNLSRRMDSEHMHIPFRSVHRNKQTDAGDTADISTYPIDSETIRYNSGNHFTSRPANCNVFDENSKRCRAKSGGQLHVFYKHGYLEDRLQEVKQLATSLKEAAETRPQFFVICSRHSPAEGHYGVSLVIMDPVRPDFPQRVMVCDTLLKQLPQHPRWWNHFVDEFSNVFGHAVAEIIEDLSHPLQKVNVKGDDPYRHDWNCPYYAASMADALADVVQRDPELAFKGSLQEIHHAMTDVMPDYYLRDHEIKDRAAIQQTNRLKRWKSGRELIKDLVLLGKQKSAQL